MKNTETNPVAEKAAAEARAKQATEKLDQAKAAVKKTTADLDTASGETEAKQRARQAVAGVKEFAAADLAQTKADFAHVHDRLVAWDAAATRDFYARLDAADAQIAAWKAKADVNRAQQRIQAHDDLATLEEKIALARARAAEAKHEKYAARSQAALEDAARAFGEAYNAAARRYESKA